MLINTDDPDQEQPTAYRKEHCQFYLTPQMDEKMYQFYLGETLHEIGYWGW